MHCRDGNVRGHELGYVHDKGLVGGIALKSALQRLRPGIGDEGRRGVPLLQFGGEPAADFKQGLAG